VAFNSIQVGVSEKSPFSSEAKNKVFEKEKPPHVKKTTTTPPSPPFPWRRKGTYDCSKSFKNLVLGETLCICDDGQLSGCAQSVALVRNIITP
jgi:hypothetical protein